MADTIRNLLRILTTPSCWIQNNTYSSAWDKRLKELMAAYKFTPARAHTATIGGYLIWVSNHPYASFSPYGLLHDCRPCRSTILMAMDKLIADYLEKPETSHG